MPTDVDSTARKHAEAVVARPYRHPVSGTRPSGAWPTPARGLCSPAVEVLPQVEQRAGAAEAEVLATLGEA